MLVRTANVLVELTTLLHLLRLQAKVAYQLDYLLAHNFILQLPPLSKLGRLIIFCQSYFQRKRHATGLKIKIIKKILDKIISLLFKNTIHMECKMFGGAVAPVDKPIVRLWVS